MKLNYISWIISLVIMTFMMSSCFESEYSKLVKAELAENMREDSLVFNIRFGDTRKDFFQKCMQLNQKQLVSQGPSNSAVQHVFVDSVFHETPTPIRLLFYPKFDEDEFIKSIDLEFSYLAWSPWNQKFQSDSLKVKVLQMLEAGYGGNQFINVTIKEKDLPVKLDSNRRMMVYLKDTETVVVKVQDILHPHYRHSISQ